MRVAAHSRCWASNAALEGEIAGTRDAEGAQFATPIQELDMRGQGRDARVRDSREIPLRRAQIEVFPLLLRSAPVESAAANEVDRRSSGRYQGTLGLLWGRRASVRRKRQLESREWKGLGFDGRNAFCAVVGP